MSYIKENFEIVKIHLDRLEKAIKEINERGLLTNFDTEDFEVIKVIDTFIYRFLKLQDYMGNKLFKTFLETIGEYQDYMSFIDVLDRLEKLRIINSSQDWLSLRKLRNKLTHEYPDELEELKEEIKLAMDFSSLMKETLNKIEIYLKERNLL